MNGIVVILLSSIVMTANKGGASTINEIVACPHTAIRLRNSCFHFSRKALAWREAFYICQERNASLVDDGLDIRDLHDIVAYLRKGFLGSNSYWIGANHYGVNSSIWARTARPINQQIYYKYYNVAPAIPDQASSCFAINAQDNYRWRVQNCFEPLNYICVTKIKKGAPSVDSGIKKNIVEVSSFKDIYDADANKTHIQNEIPEMLQLPQTRRKTKAGRQYRCPRRFRRAGRFCYHYSPKQKTWRSAYFACRDMIVSVRIREQDNEIHATSAASSKKSYWKHLRNVTRLAVIPDRVQDRALRRLTTRIRVVDGRERESRWMGGSYDWEEGAWRWADSGAIIHHENREYRLDDGTQIRENDRLRWHCLVWDPKLTNRWTSSTCYSKKYYLCQTDAEML